MNKIFVSLNNGNISMYLSIKLLIMFVISLLVITSCTTVINNTNIEERAKIISNENKIIIDIGKGKSGGTVSFKINLSEVFKTKANVNGWDSLYNSINSYKISLVTTSGGGSLTTAPTNTSADVINITKAAITGIKTSLTSQVFLTNVPAGTYWVAVAAYDLQGRNVTKTTSTTGTIAVIGGEIFAVSTGGGNGDISPNNGMVTVTSTFSLPSAAVTIPLTLTDPFGANIQATVAITDGITKVKANINLIRFYLVNSKTTSNLVDANIIKGSFDLTAGSLFTSLKAGTSTTINFVSVTSGTYYIAVAAYNSSAIVDSTTNITNLTANTFANITITSAPTPTGNMGTFSISDTGGDGGAAPGPGRLVVNSNYGVSSSAAVVLNLKLLD